MRMRMRIVGLLVAVFLSASSLSGQQRLYRVDDNFAREEVPARSVVLSADGVLAFTKLRAANTQVANGLTIDEARSDIWLQEAPGHPAQNLTNGAADSSGWWSPQWSPDGKWLAFLSSRGGEVRLWAWERAQKRLRQLSRIAVDPRYNAGCSWIDGRRLLCLALPEGERSTTTSIDHYGAGSPIERAASDWARAQRGELTANVMNSLKFPQPQRRLILVDVSSDRDEEFARTQLNDQVFDGLSFWISPTGKAVAFVQPGAGDFGLVQRTVIGWPVSIDIRRLDGRPLRLSQRLPTNVLSETIQWSADGESIVFFALGTARIHPALIYGEGAREVEYPAVASKDYPGHLWRVNLASGVVERLSTGDVDLGQNATPPRYHWAASGELLFRTPRLVQGARPLVQTEPEWLLLGPGGKTRRLTNGKQQLPASLEAIDGGSAFLGLMEGDLWRISPGNGAAINLTKNLQAAVHGFDVAPDVASTKKIVVSIVRDPRTAFEKMQVAQGRGLEFLSDYYLIDVRSGASTSLSQPGSRAALVAFDQVSQSAIWLANDRNGTYLWRATTSRPADTLVATNTFMKTVMKGEQRTIDYTTMNGERMQAKVVLPVGYQAGRRYPMVVDFDIGYTPDQSSHYAAKDASDFPELYEETFAAGGYVYMFASWPSTGMDNVGRANLLLGPNGVIPAVDEAVRLGIADPERLFLYGASSAGYGVYALVTQTSRFKAAAASAGWVDQITVSLTPSILERYSLNPFNLLRVTAGAKSGIMLPVWRNADHARRNSPLSYVDRVQTPLLILHGELDPVQITEPEMFFTALAMQRKPAQFVRYGGEGHGNGVPANARDFFQRIFAWYDEWGDIARDTAGNMIFEGDRVQSRKGAPPLPAEAYAKFGPTAPASTSPQPGRASAAAN